MDSLTTDARGIPATYFLAKDLVKNEEILERIEDEDLDIGEKLSVVFLMMDDAATEARIILRLLEDPKDRLRLVSSFVRQAAPRDWQERLLEALCIMQLHNVSLKLGITSMKEMEDRYSPKLLEDSLKIRKDLKALYKLCESLETTNELLDRVSKDKDRPQRELDLEVGDLLEFHILTWIKSGYIEVSSDGKMDATRLLKVLKAMGLAEERIYRAIESFGTPSCLKNFNAMELTGERVNRTNGTFRTPTNMEADACSAFNAADNCNGNIKNNFQFSSTDEYVIKKGCCVIINQIKFGGTYDEREGTNCDRDRLLQVFGAFNFTTHNHQNLNHQEMNDILNEISTEDAFDCDCMVLCILSHGISGHIITTDEKEYSIERIEEQLCCKRLRGKPKVLFMQACQGSVIGHNPNLTTDGPTTVGHFPVVRSTDIGIRADFFGFYATIDGMMSIRDKKSGSWFIQTLCNVLETSGRNGVSLSDCATEVNRSIEKERGSVHGVASAGQLPISKSTLKKKIRFIRRQNEP